MYIVDNETIKSLIKLYGFNYDKNIHGARTTMLSQMFTLK